MDDPSPEVFSLPSSGVRSVAGFDAGGTGHTATLATPDGRAAGHTSVSTGAPPETSAPVVETVGDLIAAAGADLVGFGPVDADRTSPRDGMVLNTSESDRIRTPLWRPLMAQFGPLDVLPHDHEVWTLAGDSLAQRCRVLTLGALAFALGGYARAIAELPGGAW